MAAVHVLYTVAERRTHQHNYELTCPGYTVTDEDIRRNSEMDHTIKVVSMKVILC